MPAFAGDVAIPTRFGTLSIDKGYVVHFNGRAVRPKVQGNNGLSVERVFRLATADVVLFEDVGGTACPSLWYIVAVSRSGAAATPEFGSCGELLGVVRKGETIIVSTRGFRGPFEPEADKARAAKEEHVFVFRRGVVTEGKTVPAP